MVAALLLVLFGVVALLAPLVSAHGANASPNAPATSAARAAEFTLPPIRHVFVIVLENEDYASTFGSAVADPYLSKVLPSEGTLLTRYYGIGHYSNDNYIARISGQPPNPATQLDCSMFVNFPAAKLLAGDIEPGNGCVYPKDVETIANQLEAKGFTWKGYEQDMGNISSRETAACGHPKVGSADDTEVAVNGDGYASRHDPFVYFHSIIDSVAYCDAHVVALGSPTGAMPASARKGETGLVTDLKAVTTTPNFSIITPNLCNDGHDYPCVNQKSGASRLADIDTFLATWVPKITHSAAFKQDGLLVVTFDEAGADSTACCGEKPGPAAPEPGLNGPGGGRIGAVLISPFIKPGGIVFLTEYNHYSLLASIEALFGLPRLGDALTVPTIFGPPVFTRPKG
jgi:hypothetical protein